MTESKFEADFRRRVHLPVEYWPQPPSAMDTSEVRHIFAAMTASLPVVLHPLVRLLALPTLTELERIKARLRKNGWAAGGAWVTGAAGKRLLVDPGWLWAWTQLANKTLPEHSWVCIGEPEALLWHIEHHIADRPGWPAGRRAAHLALLAPVAKRQLRLLRAESEADGSATTNAVLASLAGISSRELAYARALLRKKPAARFGDLLRGKPGALRARELEQCPVRGSPAGRARMEWLTDDTKPADLALVDTTALFPGLFDLYLRDLERLVKCEGFVLLLCPPDQPSPEFAQRLAAANSEPVFLQCGELEALWSVERRPGEPVRVTTRRIVVFRRNDFRLSQEAFHIVASCSDAALVVPKESVNDAHRELMSLWNVFDGPGRPRKQDCSDEEVVLPNPYAFRPRQFRAVRKYDLRQSLDARQCRLITCERLLLAYCPRKQGRVFVPAIPGHCPAKLKHFLATLRSAAGRRQATVIIYKSAVAGSSYSRARPGWRRA